MPRLRLWFLSRLLVEYGLELLCPPTVPMVAGISPFNFFLLCRRERLCRFVALSVAACVLFDKRCLHPYRLPPLSKSSQRCEDKLLLSCEVCLMSKEGVPAARCLAGCVALGLASRRLLRVTSSLMCALRFSPCNKTCGQPAMKKIVLKSSSICIFTESVC